MDSSDISGAITAATEPGTAVDYRSLVVESADLTTVASLDGVYRYASPASLRLFGWDPAELVGHRQDEFVHPHDIESVHAAQATLANVEFVLMSYRQLCRDGSLRWAETTARRVGDSGSELLVSVVRDVTERRQRMLGLERQALIDPLTRVANRTVLMDRIHQGLLRLGRGTGVLAVLYLDLDRFKVVNDSLGHQVGDAVLVQMAERLAHHLRPADTLARLGGDEFVIVAEGISDEQAVIDLAERTIEAGREPFAVGDENFVCTLSVGIACTADSERGANELLGEADLALYRAKDRGRDRAELFDEELRTKAVVRLVAEQMLRSALDDRKLVVEYQPIIDLRAGCLVGAEALVRISGPNGGLLPPSMFLEVAEETGMLIEIDEQVLADAVAQASFWHSRLPGSQLAEVAINVTARHLADAGFQRSIIDRLDGHGVGHHCLQVELAERVLLEASNSAMSGLRALRHTGVQVGLDDFGSGYSSLASLRQFPLDFVKLDRSLISGLERDDGERALIAAIIDMAHALKLTVVAEGVETEGQRRILEDFGCDRAQGFVFAPSGPPGAIVDLVAAAAGRNA